MMHEIFMRLKISFQVYSELRNGGKLKEIVQPKMENLLTLKM